GLDDFEILLAQRPRDREDIVLLGLVIFILGIVADARWRHRGKEHVFGLGLGHCGFQRSKVAAYGVLAGVGDRPDAGMAGRAGGAARKLLLHEFIEANAV